MKKVLVIGSFIMDHVVLTPRIPEEGETIIGTSFQQFPGGKGANQAVAAARLGADVTMVGKVGKDNYGDQFVSVLEREGIDTTHILRGELPTGIGSVTLDERGNNRIVIVPGSNMEYMPEEIDRIAGLIKEAGVVVLQLEMPIPTIVRAVEVASQFNVPVILNPAPAATLPEDLYRCITYLTPNETEAELLMGVRVRDVNSAERAGRVLLDKGVRNVVLTLGEKGALIVNREGMIHVPAYTVKAVDTVGAGDSFNGALAYGVVSGISLEETVRLANAVGALTVTRRGAIPSLPTDQEVQDFLK